MAMSDGMAPHDSASRNVRVKGRRRAISLPGRAGPSLVFAVLMSWTAVPSMPLTAQATSAHPVQLAGRPIVNPVYASSAATDDGMRVLVSVDHLILQAASYRGARRELERVGPLAASGELANGVTDYDLNPRLKPQSDGTTCHATAVVVDVSVRILLPEWLGASLVPVKQYDRWRTFITTLTSHENAHRDVTIRAAETLRARLADLSEPTCPRLIRKVERTMHTARAELDAAHAALDRADATAVAVRW